MKKVRLDGVVWTFTVGAAPQNSKGKTTEESVLLSTKPELAASRPLEHCYRKQLLVNDPRKCTTESICFCTRRLSAARRACSSTSCTPATQGCCPAATGGLRTCGSGMTPPADPQPRTAPHSIHDMHGEASVVVYSCFSNTGRALREFG